MAGSEEGGNVDSADDVGRLHLRDSNQPTLETGFRLFPHDELDIGRSAIYQALGTEDRCISSHHLKIHCVMYGDPDQDVIAPMVYMKVLSMNAVILTRRRSDGTNASITISKDNDHVLLNDGDSVQLTHSISMTFETILEGTAVPLSPSCKIEVATFANQYRLSERLLGQGGYASVHVAEKLSTGQQFACKVVPLDDEAKESSHNAHGVGVRQAAVREYEILKNLSHPNVVSLEKVITTPYNVYIFQEIATGGDLLSYIEKKAPISETHAAFIIKQLLEAVKYLHDHHVVHRDIKPENILMTSWNDCARLILTDFGQSKTIADFEDAAKDAGLRRMHTMVGTVGYIAPEVLRRRKADLEQSSGYSKAVDMWSLGCTASALMTNYPLFPDHPMTETEYVDHLAVLEHNEEWKYIGHRGKTFIKGCLTANESKRLTADQALQLPWFTHPFYKAEFDGVYQKAIQDWEPKQHDPNLIERIDTTEGVEKHKRRVQESTRSKHFAAGQSTFLINPTGRQHARDELHASPAPSLHTPPPLRQQSFRRTSEPQNTLDSIVLPPGHDRYNNASLDDLDDLSQAISLPPPKTQDRGIFYAKRSKVLR